MFMRARAGKRFVIARAGELFCAMVQFQKAQRLLRGIGFTKDAVVSLARSLARLVSASGKVLAGLRQLFREFRKTNTQFEIYRL
jgi:hypothetical protein